MKIHDTLLAYSEWLDSEGLIVGDADSNDQRSHDELATDFLAKRIPLLDESPRSIKAGW